MVSHRTPRTRRGQLAQRDHISDLCWDKPESGNTPKSRNKVDVLIDLAVEGSCHHKKTSFTADTKDRKKRTRDLPLYHEYGLAVVSSGTVVVFIPTRVDKVSCMVFGFLPEYGGPTRAEAVIPFSSLACDVTDQANMVRALRRRMRPFAAVAMEITETTARGVESVEYEELRMITFTVTLDKRSLQGGHPAWCGGRTSEKKEEGSILGQDQAALDLWQSAARAAWIVDATAHAMGCSVVQTRKSWLWGLFESLEEDREANKPTATLPPIGSLSSAGQILELFSALAQFGTGSDPLSGVESFEKSKRQSTASSTTIRNNDTSSSSSFSSSPVVCSCQQNYYYSSNNNNNFVKAYSSLIAQADPAFISALKHQAAKSLKAFLRPVKVRREVRLSHRRVDAVRSGALAAMGVEPPLLIRRPGDEDGHGIVRVSVLSPPTYVITVTSPSSDRVGLVEDFLDKCAHAATCAVKSYNTTAAAGAGAGESGGKKKKRVTISDDAPLVFTVPNASEESRFGTWVVDAARERRDNRLLVGKEEGSNDGAKEKDDEDDEGDDDDDDDGALLGHQPVLNVGLVGHVAHGKSSVCRYLTGQSTQQHSAELRLHGTTIKLGYANCKVYKCFAGCPPPDCFVSSGDRRGESEEPTVVCRVCLGPTRLVQHVSFVDCPGHRDLLATMFTGCSALDAVMVITAANEHVPAPQAASHLEVIKEVMGFGGDRVCVVQNKAELVFTKQDKGEDAGETKSDDTEKLKIGMGRLTRHGRACQALAFEYDIDGAPILPVSAELGHNMELLTSWLAELAPRSTNGKCLRSRYSILRSFDTNRAGAEACRLRGGVLGGNLKSGSLSPGDRIEIRPGHVHRCETTGSIKAVEPIIIMIRRVMSGDRELAIARPGGLVAVETDLDPSLTRQDRMAGMVAGLPGSLPPCYHTLTIEDMTWLHDDTESDDDDKAVTASTLAKFCIGEKVRLHVGACSSIVRVTRVSNRRAKVKFKIHQGPPLVCAKDDRVVMERRVSANGERVKKCQRRASASSSSDNGNMCWQLAAFGSFKSGEACEVRGNREGDRHPLNCCTKKEDSASVANEVEEDDEDGSNDDCLDESCCSNWLHDYDRWATRFLSKMKSVTSHGGQSLLSQKRVKVPPVKMLWDGGQRVVWTNFDDCCEALQRPPSHVASFLTTQGLGEISLDAKFKQLRMRGRAIFRTHKTIPDQIGRLLRRYCMEFVCCRQCRGANTTLTTPGDCLNRSRSSRSKIVRCLDCGARFYTWGQK